MADPTDLDRIYRAVNAAHLKTWLSPQSPRYRHSLEFAVTRLETGRKLLDALQRDFPSRLSGRPRLLDLGSGNGGVTFPFAAAGFECLCLEPFLHPEQFEVTRRTGLKVRSLLGRAQRLPIAAGTVDLALYLEVIEHLDLADVRMVGQEIARVLRPGGLCVVTTPPRLRFLLRRDPHWRIPALVAVPNPVQRWIVDSLLRRRPSYDVSRIYWSVSQIMATLPGLRLLQVTGPLRRTPLRRFDWEWIIAECPVA